MSNARTYLKQRREDKAWKWATFALFFMWVGLIVDKLIGLILN